MIDVELYYNPYAQRIECTSRLGVALEYREVGSCACLLARLPCTAERSPCSIVKVVEKGKLLFLFLASFSCVTYWKRVNAARCRKWSARDHVEMHISK